MSNKQQLNVAELEAYLQQSIRPVHHIRPDNQAALKQPEILQQLRHAKSLEEILQLLEEYHALDTTRCELGSKKF